jgi:hypothetical protein
MRTATTEHSVSVLPQQRIYNAPLRLAYIFIEAYSQLRYLPYRIQSAYEAIWPQ